MIAKSTVIKGRGGKSGGRGSPNDDCAERRQRQDDNSKVEPGSITAGILGHDADRHPQNDPDEIARSLPKRRHVFELGARDSRGYNDEDGDENRSDRQSSEPDTPGYLSARIFRSRRCHRQLT